MLSLQRNHLLELLDDQARRWLDAASPWHQKVVASLTVSTGLTPRQIILAVDNAFSELTRPHLAAFVASGSDPTEKLAAPLGSDPARKAQIVCPGNVFTAWLPAAVLCLLEGCRITLKPSIHEPVFPALWCESLGEVREAVTIGPWSPSALQPGDRVIVYGNNATLDRLRAEVGPGVTFIGFGHQTSAAVIFPEAMTPELWPQTRAAAMAAIEPFNLQGCLSPSVLWIPEAARERWAGVARRLQPFPELRAYARMEEISAGLNAWPGRLASVGWAGDVSREKLLRAAVAAEVRLCPLSLMQRPPLAWTHEGISRGCVGRRKPVE